MNWIGGRLGTTRVLAACSNCSAILAVILRVLLELEDVLAGSMTTFVKVIGPAVLLVQ